MGNSEIPKICKAAIRAGVNFIDTSPWYGNSEANIGKALKEERVPRQAYYIATKVATETRGRQHGSKTVASVATQPTPGKYSDSEFPRGNECQFCRVGEKRIGNTSVLQI